MAPFYHKMWPRSLLFFLYIYFLFKRILYRQTKKCVFLVFVFAAFSVKQKPQCSIVGQQWIYTLQHTLYWLWSLKTLKICLRILQSPWQTCCCFAPSVLVNPDLVEDRMLNFFPCPPFFHGWGYSFWGYIHYIHHGKGEQSDILELVLNNWC